MKIPFFNMNVEDMATSKGMIGGIVVIALGVYLIMNMQMELGIALVGGGLSLMGIRDATT